MLTNKFPDTAGIRQRIPVHRALLMLLLVPLASFQAFADEVDGPDTAPAQSAQRAAKLPPAIEIKANAYQACVNSVMSTMEPAAAKRQQIADRCGGARLEMVQAFPEQIRQLIETNTDRRIESVLVALEQIENAVIESAEDVNEISEDLNALSETTPNK